jgi:hypothetical protein
MRVARLKRSDGFKRLETGGGRENEMGGLYWGGGRGSGYFGGEIEAGEGSPSSECRNEVDGAWEAVQKPGTDWDRGTPSFGSEPVKGDGRRGGGFMNVGPRCLEVEVEGDARGWAKDGMEYVCEEDREDRGGAAWTSRRADGKPWGGTSSAELPKKTDRLNEGSGSSINSAIDLAQIMKRRDQVLKWEDKRRFKLTRHRIQRTDGRDYVGTRSLDIGNGKQTMEYASLSWILPCLTEVYQDTYQYIARDRYRSCDGSRIFPREFPGEWPNSRRPVYGSVEAGPEDVLS